MESNVVLKLIDKNNLYYTYNDWILGTIYMNKYKDIDLKSIKVISDVFLKDKNYVYYFWYKKENYKDSWNIYKWLKLQQLHQVDINSFEILSDIFLKDKNHIFYINKNYNSDNNQIKILKEADVDTFKVLNEVYAIDKNNVYFEEKRQPYDKDMKVVRFVPNFNIKTLSNVDIETFVIIDWHFAKDKNNYFWLKCIDTDEWHCDWEEIDFIDILTQDDYNEKIKKLTYEAKNSFQVINNNFLKDKKYIYSSNWEKYAFLDYDTFQALWMGLCKDKNGVYCLYWYSELKKIDFLDKDTILIPEYEYSNNNEYESYLVDKNWTYIWNKLNQNIKKMNISSGKFKPITSDIFRINNQMYIKINSTDNIELQSIDFIDVMSLQFYTPYIFKDKHNIYTFDNKNWITIQKDVDYATFREIF